MAKSTEITALQQAWRESHPGEAVVASPSPALSEQENWHFDTQGFLCLPAVATPSDLQAPAELVNHPVLQRYAGDLCGIGYRLDTPVRDVAELDPGRLVGGDARTRDPAREYFHTAAGYILTEDSQQNPTYGYNDHVHVRQCQGLLAIWALRDVEAGTGFALVPCSHLADVEPPNCLNYGQDLDGPLSVISQPTMHAGDLLLVAEATMHGLLGTHTLDPGCQVVCGFISRTAPPSVGSVALAAPRSATPYDPMPAFISKLSPTARAMIAAPAGTPHPTDQIVQSDGQTVWLEEPNSATESHPGLTGGIGTPSHEGIDPEEVFFFDLTGFLVVRGVMNGQWLDEARAAVEPFYQAPVSQEMQMTEHPAMAGTPRPSCAAGNLFELPGRQGAVFHRCIDHPAVVSRLNWMLAGGSVTSTLNANLLMMSQGSVGQVIHSGVTNPTAAGHHYAYRNGRVMAGASLNVAWQLADSPPGSGGFVISPGSHKAQWGLPQAVRWADDRSTLREVNMKAGDVLFFLGSSVAHGAVRWEREEWRSVMLLQYQARHAAWSGRLWAPRL